LIGTGVSTLAIDPQTPSTLYVGVSGVFMSVNGGETWSAANRGLTDTYNHVLAIDPQTPTTLYAGTAEDGVFKGQRAHLLFLPLTLR